jgi:6-phosphogluconolactonase
VTAFVEYVDSAALAEGLASQVANDLRSTLEKKNRATLAVPGGSTPGPFLAALAAEELDWRRIAVCPTDERWAPPDDERSNERMIRKALLDNGAAPDFLPYWRESLNPVEAVPVVAEAFAPYLPLDVCVIGMGTDMHCASLFPGGDGLAAAMDPKGTAVMAAIAAPGAPEPRITLTAARLTEAGKLYLLIIGPEKRAALTGAKKEADALKAPVGAVLRRANKAQTHWAER